MVGPRLTALSLRRNKNPFTQRDLLTNDCIYLALTNYVSLSPLCLLIALDDAWGTKIKGENLQLLITRIQSQLKLGVSCPVSSRSVQDSDFFWQCWQSFHWEAKDYPSRARQNLRQFISQFLHSAPPLPHWEAYSTTGEYWLHRRCRQRAESIYVVENLWVHAPPMVPYWQLQQDAICAHLLTQKQIYWLIGRTTTVWWHWIARHIIIPCRGRTSFDEMRTLRSAFRQVGPG